MPVKASFRLIPTSSSLETNSYPGPEPGLTTNITWFTTNQYPENVPSLISNCTDFVIVSDDPGPQPCFSTNSTVTTSDYPGPLPGLITNISVTVTNLACISGVTNVTIITNSPCSGLILSARLISWCAENGIQTGTAIQMTTTFPPAAGTLCPGSGITTNFAAGGKKLIGYTYIQFAGFTYTTNVPVTYTTNVTVDFTTNSDCDGITNYSYTFPNGGYACMLPASATHTTFTLTIIRSPITTTAHFKRADISNQHLRSYPFLRKIHCHERTFGNQHCSWTVGAGAGWRSCRALTDHDCPWRFINCLHCRKFIDQSGRLHFQSDRPAPKSNDLLFKKRNFRAH